MGSAMADLPLSVSPSRATTLGGGYILAGAGAILFSLKGILAKLAYGDGAAPEVDAITLMALRMAFSLPFYIVAGAYGWKARAARGEPTFSRGLLVKAVLVGLLGFYVSSYLDFAGLQYLSAQFERLILMTYPIFVVLLGAAFFGARLHKKKCRRARHKLQRHRVHLRCRSHSQRRQRITGRGFGLRRVVYLRTL